MSVECLSQFSSTAAEFPMSEHGIELSSAARKIMLAHLERAYPEEGCGFLVGPLPLDGRNPERIEEAVPSANVKQEDRTHRFLIPTEEVARMERSLEGTGRAILGYYHSHPDHPAFPSAFDRDHAWPWYVYLVISVAGGRVIELNAFQLDPNREGFLPRTVFPDSNSNEREGESKP
jgi:proteasome lid subunit RPN8/RPN11